MEVKTNPYFLVGSLLPGSVSESSFLCSYSNACSDMRRRAGDLLWQCWLKPLLKMQSYLGATLQTNLLTWLQDKTESRSELQETKGNWKGTTQRACKFHKSVCMALRLPLRLSYLYQRGKSLFFFFFPESNTFRNQINTSYEKGTGSRLGINCFCSFCFQSIVLSDLLNNVKSLIILNRRLYLTCFSKSCFMPLRN